MSKGVSSSHLFHDVVVGEILDPDHHVLAEIAEASRQALERLIGNRLELGEGSAPRRPANRDL